MSQPLIAAKPPKIKYRLWLRNIHVRRLYVIIVYPLIYLPLIFIHGGLAAIYKEFPEIKESWGDTSLSSDHNN